MKFKSFLFSLSAALLSTTACHAADVLNRPPAFGAIPRAKPASEENTEDAAYFEAIRTGEIKPAHTARVAMRQFLYAFARYMKDPDKWEELEGWFRLLSRQTRKDYLRSLKERPGPQADVIVRLTAIDEELKKNYQEELERLASRYANMDDADGE